MADELLPYYEKELAFIRQMGAEFSKEHPKIAGRLGISGDTIEDPHVSRLIEGVAYLNARIQHKLDDDFPELSDALLNVIFPHYQRPIPSMSIVQFMPDVEQLDSRFQIPAKTLLETEYFQGENCRFATAFDTTLEPLTLESASMIGAPLSTPGANRMKGCAGVLKLTFKTFNNLSLQEIRPGKLRLYLKGQSQHIHPLYEKLMSDSHSMVIASSDADLNPVILGKDSIKAVGFSADEGLLPYPPQSFVGYRMLTEFFVFPEKYMFVDIDGIETAFNESYDDSFTVYIYLGSSDVELEHNISADNFLMGCTPVVNLFEHACDPIKLDHTQESYKIVADARRPLGYEVYSVDSITSTTATGEKKPFFPFYGLNHSNKDTADHAYWYAARRHAKLGAGDRDEGTDVFLNLVDLHFNPNTIEDRTLVIKAHCSNRDLPAKLPFNLEQPKLQCVDGSPPCSRIRCVTQPSRTVRPPLRNHARWRLISHLNLNHLSITGGADGAAALREILRLYDFTESSINQSLIASIISVDTRAITAPLTIDDHVTLCRGIEVDIVLDDFQLTGSSRYLFASVLEHFFALYCSINSFSRVLVRLKNKEGFLKKCPPRAGEKVLL